MEFRITHGPAAPQNDLRFVKAGILRVTPRTVVFSGKWRAVMPGKTPFWLYLMPMLLIIALSADHWVPAAWQIGVGDDIYETIKFLVILFYFISLYPQYTPLSRKITAEREALRGIARAGREVTFLLRDRKGRELHALFNTETEEEAAAIETALREGGAEQTFTITYGPAAALPIVPAPGQIVIGPESVRLEGRIPRDPYPDRRRMWKISLAIFAVTMPAALVLVILMIVSMSSGSAFEYPSVYFSITMAVMIVLISVTVIYTVRQMRVADVAKAEIADIRQQGEEVSFRAPLEGNHGVSGVTTVMRAGSPEQAATIARALADRTEGSTPFPVNYGLKRKMNPFGLAGNGRLGVTPDAVRITGDRIIALRPLPLIISLILAFVPVVIIFVLVWRAFHDPMFAVVTGAFALFVISSISSLLLRLFFGQATIPRPDIIGVEREGRQLTLHARVAGQEEQAVFHTRTEEEAAALSDALQR